MKFASRGHRHERQEIRQCADNRVAGDPENQKGRLKNIGGSQSDQWNLRLAAQTLDSLRLDGVSAEELAERQKASFAALRGIAPKDELEGMMAAQLIAAHNAATECYRRAMIGDQTFDGRRENLTQANKLSSTYATLLEALNRHRGKGGQQKVTVEHVHVHAGGQAVVGMVATPPSQPGGGETRKIEEQPHAKQIAHAPEPALPCADAGRDAVPVASDGERALPDARGQVPRRP